MDKKIEGKKRGDLVYSSYHGHLKIYSVDFNLLSYPSGRVDIEAVHEEDFDKSSPICFRYDIYGITTNQPGIDDRIYASQDEYINKIINGKITEKEKGLYLETKTFDFTMTIYQSTGDTSKIWVETYTSYTDRKNREKELEGTVQILKSVDFYQHYTL